MFEVVWAKMLALVFGNSIYATTIVILTFMAGLAIGGFIGGRFVEKSRNPLSVFVLSQLLIGIYAFCIPLFVSLVRGVYIFFAAHYENSLFYLNGIRGLLSFFIVLIPASLMGIAIPVLVKEIAAQSGKRRWAIGSVYSISSFGGALGSFLAGFLFIEKLGIAGTNYFAACLTILVSIAAFFLLLLSKKRPGAATEWSFRSGEQTKKTSSRKKVFQGNSINSGKAELSSGKTFDSMDISINSKTASALLILAFISGLTSLGYEILWLRLLVPVYESTTYTFSLVLSVFIFGLGFGNYLCFKLLKRSKRLIFYAALLEIAAGIYAICSIILFSQMLDLAKVLYSVIDILTWEKTVLIKFILSFSVLIFPTTLFGMLLPLISFIYSGYINKIGKGVGDVFYINMTGSIIGSAIAGFVLIPYFGVKTGFFIFGVTNVAIGFYIFIINNRSVKTVIISIVCLIAILMAIPVVSKTNLLKPLKGEEIVYYREGIAGNVEVSKNSKGFHILRVDNKAHGGNEPWVKVDETRIAHFSMLLHEDPKDVLLIGLGTGITLDAVARHNINSVDCVELVGELKDTVGYFFDGKPEILENRKVKIIIEDGRNYILRTKKKYDIIIMDLIHPESAGAANLFTKEYYNDAKKRIKSKGFVAQWLPLYQLSPLEFKIITRTFATVFSNASLWFGSHNQGFPLALLIGPADELLIEKEVLKKRLDLSKLSSELLEKNNADKLLDNFISDRKGLLKYTEGVRINKDDTPILEFLVPKGLFLRNHYGRENYKQLSRLKQIS